MASIVRSRTLILSAAVMCASGACSLDETGKPDNTVSLQVYQNVLPPAVDPYVIEKGAVFGRDQGDDTYLWINPSPHCVADDGNLYVLDARQTKAYIMTPQGELLRTFGKKGQGPGEFSVLQDLTLFEGHLYTNDPFNRRVTVMDTEGKYLSSHTFPLDVPTSRFLIPYRFSDGCGYILIEKDHRYPHVIGERSRAHFAVHRLSETLTIESTLYDSTGTFEFIRIAGENRSRPLDNLTPVTGLAPGMPVAWSYGKQFRVDFLDPANGDRWAVRIPHEALPMSQTFRERLIESYARLTRSSIERARRITYPDRLPHVDSMMSDLQWDPAGRLWVREFRDPTISGTPYRFQVFSRSGEWLFRQDLPVHPILFSADGFYARGEAADGSPLVQFYQFMPRR